MLKPYSRSALIYAIRERRSRKKITWIKRPERQLPPLAAEMRYVKRLRRLASLIESETRRILFPIGEKLVQKAGIVQDATEDIPGLWQDEFEQIISELQDSLGAGFAVGDAMAQGMAKDVNAWNQTQFNKVLRSVMGVQVVQAEPWLQAELETRVAENVALIQSIKDKAVLEIEDLTLTGIKSGRRWTAIQEELVQKFGATSSRAELIARDQVSKLNGNLTRVRQTQMGLKGYIWRTSLDERVRPSHRANEGQTFSWDSPPIGTGHPGQDFQCRCTAEPLYSEIKELIG